MLAICDTDHKYHLSEWEKERIQANKEAARKRKKRRIGKEKKREGCSAEYINLSDESDKEEKDVFCQKCGEHITEGVKESVCLECMAMQCEKCEVYVWCGSCQLKTCTPCGTAHERVCKNNEANRAKSQINEPVATEVVQVYRMNDSDDDEPSVCVVCQAAEEPGYALISAMCHDCLTTECGQCKDHKTCPNCNYGTCAACWEGHAERCIDHKRRKTEESRRNDEQGKQQTTKVEPKALARTAKTERGGTISNAESYETRLGEARAQSTMRVKGPPAIHDDGSLFTQAFLRRGSHLLKGREQKKAEEKQATMPTLAGTGTSGRR